MSYPNSVPTTPDSLLMELAEVKSLLGITGPTPTDDQVTFALQLATDIIRDRIGRMLVLDTYTDTFHIEAAKGQLSLAEFPLSSVTSVTGENVPSDPAEFDIGMRTGIVSAKASCFTGEVVIVYEAGYDPLPANLKGVVLEMVRRQLLAMGLTVGTAPSPSQAKAVSIGSLKVDYVMSADAMRGTTSPLLNEVVEQFKDVIDRYVHPRLLAATP